MKAQNDEGRPSEDGDDLSDAQKAQIERNSNFVAFLLGGSNKTTSTVKKSKPTTPTSPELAEPADPAIVTEVSKEYASELLGRLRAFAPDYQ